MSSPTPLERAAMSKNAARAIAAHEAQARAGERNEDNLSDVIRRALEKYVEDEG